MEQRYFIQFGSGIDLRGQSITKAAVRAVRDAVGRNTIPSVALLTGGDFDKLKVHVRLAVPADADAIDLEAIRAVLPVGTVSFEVTDGGMASQNGVGELAYIVNAAVEVGL